MVKITLESGKVMTYDQPVTAAQVARELGDSVLTTACCARINGRAADLRTPLTADCSLAFLTFEDEEGRRTFRHTAAHVLAQAVKRLYPEARLATGPATEDGFFYDFQVPTPFSPEDLENIQAEMERIIAQGESLTAFSLPLEQALSLWEEQGEPYKAQLARRHSAEGELHFYRQGEFTDLCAGPHLLDVSPLKAVKLLHCTGAYWQGDAKNPQLCRVHGTAFPDFPQLEEHERLLEEAKKRDHRRLGRELELFALLDEGPGFPFFLPRGLTLKNTLIQFWRELHAQAGYVEISTPVILNRALWERSGHWDHYRETMYSLQIDEQDYAIKPMSCPGGMLAYGLKPRSYRELPLRVGELGLVHRHELSGTLHGLMRVRCFTQDDAHIFMTKGQVKEEIKGVARLIDQVYTLFGFPYHIELSTRPENAIGSAEDWETATDALRDAVTELGYSYEVNEGDGAFYGPKLDFHLTDCLGRTWQCGTIQLDFQLPQRFSLEYTAPDGSPQRPIMLHRVIFGSIERFLGILIEHFAGAFPTWLAPVQAVVLPISQRHLGYAEQVLASLKSAGIRAELDGRNEKIGYRIRQAQAQKVPYMLVLGDREQESGQVSPRARSGENLPSVPLEGFTASLAKEATLPSFQPMVE